MTSEKERLADRDRSRRDYEETYGRGGGDRFDEGGYTHSYGTPGLGVGDWRRAMQAYVTGHDRGWSADRKYREAGASEDEGRRLERPRPEREGAPSDPVGFGVGVPDRDDFSFHRGASTWRDRLPAAERLPRHTDRQLDGQRGEGDQA